MSLPQFLTIEKQESRFQKDLYRVEVQYADGTVTPQFMKKEDIEYQQLLQKLYSEYQLPLDIIRELESKVEDLIVAKLEEHED